MKRQDIAFYAAKDKLIEAFMKITDKNINIEKLKEWLLNEELEIDEHADDIEWLNNYIPKSFQSSVS